jgi:hypothetical protein
MTVRCGHVCLWTCDIYNVGFNIDFKLRGTCEEVLITSVRDNVTSVKDAVGPL